MSGSDLSGTVLDGRYQVIAPIAEGAMGAVYRGERLKLGKAVAIKIMHDALPDELASRQRFEREAKLMARLEHPHCVSVIDFGLHDGRPFLVMELVRGTSLLELLEKHGRFEVTRAVDLVRQVLSGLGHAHELGIVHRDIKPANVMLAQKTGLGEQVRILDFGLARPAIPDSTKLTTGIVVGTPNYMAPEQIKGGDIDARADLYASAILLFELVTGQKPFVADDPIAVVRKHLNEPPPTLASVGADDLAELEPIIARGLAKSPNDRYATAAEMSSALEKAIDKRGARQVADLMSHAVPKNVYSSTAPQVATMSGWSVPHGDGSIPQASSNLLVPLSDSGAVSGPNIGQSGPNAVPHPMSGVPGSIPNAIPGSAPHSAGSVPHSAPIQAPPNAGASGVMVTHASGAIPTTDDSQAKTSLALDTVPQTRRNRVVSRPIPHIPLTQRQLIAVGGGVLLLIIVIAATRHGGGGATKSAATDAAVVQAPSDAGGEPVAAALARASDLYAQGDLEPALDIALKARRQHPESPQLAFITGKIYFAKLYWTDGLKHLRDAIRLDPGYRSDPELIKIALRGFITTPDTDSRLEEFLRVDLGDVVAPYLEETARDNPNATVRSRAAAELRRLH